jgi:hypothetical protein
VVIAKQRLHIKPEVIAIRGGKVKANTKQSLLSKGKMLDYKTLLLYSLLKLILCHHSLFSIASRKEEKCPN